MVEQQDYEFLQAFWTRRAVVAYSLFAFNIIVFVLMTLAGGSQNEPTLMAFGVKANVLIDNGEVWRFVTPIFLHIGLLHLAFNSYALWIVGPQVEKLYGSARFMLLYLVTGISGVAASYWYHPYVISAGASGSIFGLFGVLLVFSYRYRKTIPAFFSQALGKGILMTVGINLVIGFLIPQVDNAAHVGGLIAGGVLAAVVPFSRPGEAERPAFKFVQSALVLLVALSFFQIVTHYNGPGLSLRNLIRGGGRSGGEASVRNVAESIARAQVAFEHSEMELESGDPLQLEGVQQELARSIEVLSKIPSVSGSSDTLREQLLDLLQKQSAYVQEVERTGQTRSDFIGASPQSVRYRGLKNRIDDWFESEAASYGITRRK